MASKNYNKLYMVPDMDYVYRRKISNTRSNIARANDYHLYETERDLITECYRVLFNIAEVTFLWDVHDDPLLDGVEVWSEVDTTKINGFICVHLNKVCPGF